MNSRIINRFITLCAMLLMCVTASARVTYSRSVPCMFINTENGDSILSRTDYLDATMYIVSYGFHGFSDMGSRSSQIKLQIRGRGNWTWDKFEKKPYRIKLDKEASLLGMASNKHWALLAHADDGTGFYRNTVGFEVSRMMDMFFTPHQQPVELVINGEYQGLYMLTETVRVGKNRLTITAEEDHEQNSELIGKGGWLVEFDNYSGDNQISVNVAGTGLETFYVTWHNPEVLSVGQKSYLTNQFTAIKNAIFSTDPESTEWQEYLDIDALARYCIVSEITSHQEAFFGSCYLYKDAGQTKWHFGPVWDFGNSLTEYQRDFLWLDNTFGKSIMTEMAKFTALQYYIRSIWPAFYQDALQHLDEYVESFAADISRAAAADAQRWPQYGHANIDECCAFVKQSLHSRIEWLNRQWGNSTGVAPVMLMDTDAPAYSIDGIMYPGIQTPNGKRLIIKGGKKYLVE